jgi:hypothetical protein
LSNFFTYLEHRQYPYVFPPCEHHINATHYQPCGASKPTPKCDRKEEVYTSFNSDESITGLFYFLEQAKPRFHGKSVYSVPAKKIQEEIMTYGASLHNS